MTYAERYRTDPEFRERCKARQKEYYLANKQRYLDYWRAYAKTWEYRVKRSARMRERYLTDAEYREHQLAYHRAWYHAHKDKGNDNTSRVQEASRG